MNARTVIIVIAIVVGLWALLPVLAPQQGPVLSTWPGGSAGTSPVIRGAAERQPAPDSAQTVAAIDQYLSGLTTSGQFSGAVLVAKNGAVVIARGYGAADAAGSVPNSPETRFRLASISKQFTAMAIMQLVDRGQIGLDTPACEYLDSCPAAWQRITVRHLLSHTSGLPNFTDFGSYEATMAQPTTPEDLVARFRDQPLLNEPGAVYRYINSGYVLLGVIVERVGGTNYGEYLDEHVFGPLGMRESGYDLGGAGVAQGFDAPGLPCAVLHASTLFASGGLYSSVRDLYRWDQALYTSALLPDDLRAQMFTPQAGSYGFGWIITQRGGQRSVEHPGLMSGAATQIVRLPEAGATVIVLSNLYTANVEAIASQLVALTLDDGG
ncbi:MAG: beta-lactamase family protein [Roseiflexaceae bacterium]|nr:beta-lactamase family protein [Roseiflexaceae bacterium]